MRVGGGGSGFFVGKHASLSSQLICAIVAKKVVVL